MARLVLIATKFRKKGLVLNKKSSVTLSDAIKVKYGQSVDARIRIGRRMFYPTVRNDGRIEIPADIIKKARLKEGRISASIHKVRQRDIVTRKANYKVARRRAVIIENYQDIPFYLVDTKKLKENLYKAILIQAHTHISVYYRLFFYFYDTRTGEIMPLVFSFPELESYDVTEKPAVAYAQISNFVDESFEDVTDISTRPYVERMTFMKSSVHGNNFMKEKIRVRNI